MKTAVVLFTRDLRIHDHPALAAACADADRVVPLFVFDDAVLASPLASPNKLAFLLDSVNELTSTMRDLGGALFKRRGDVAEEVAKLCAETETDAVYCSDDVSRYGTRRIERLREALDSVELGTFNCTTVQAPGAITTGSGDHYQRFTPYWRKWEDTDVRPLADVPDRIRAPTTLAIGSTPHLSDLTDEPTSPELPSGGESAGRDLLDDWLDGPVDGYDTGHDDLAGDATSRLSPYLHLGCVSPVEIVHRTDRSSDGADAFIRQVCWRDYHHQVLAAAPEAAWSDYTDRGDAWRDDDEALRAWRDGRTGYPIVDAGMRQLLREGWMHNRARLIVGSFLVRDLYIDWRAGAAHFLRWLVDGDLANNQMNWQWVAGTGTHSRPNRVFSPLRQAERFDPEGDYVRRYVPELAGIEGGAVHTPWELPDDVRAELDYPAPLVDHTEAVARFRAARGLD
jgi:deoxyribodipyrimidine photo-lyase